MLENSCAVVASEVDPDGNADLDLRSWSDGRLLAVLHVLHQDDGEPNGIVHLLKGELDRRRQARLRKKSLDQAQWREPGVDKRGVSV
jgi:hypothetical protein